MTRARVLVADDEPDLRAMLADYLDMQGFDVSTAADAPELGARLAAGPVDVIVLDINMPGETGLAALARLRAAGLAAGVILLTAAGTLETRLDGLRAGADDFMEKPFEPRELLARIRAVLRRLEPSQPPAPDAPAPAVRMGRCSFDPVGRCLRDAEGRSIALTAMEFDLLDVFVRHPRQILSRARLAELAHGRPLEPGDRSIDIRVTRLRAKIGEAARASRTLRTVHGEGYLYDPDA
ncbi:MAG: response regulator transcription factor [Amaricoccus sp.]|uniref:response regulator n=1 Tax=Amaricoccus sp. TaxID=1872485 RepID=UPI0039E5453C